MELERIAGAIHATDRLPCSQKPRQTIRAKLPYTTGVSHEKPRKKSVRNNATSGTTNAARLSAKVALPNSAIAAIGVRLGGCGSNRETAAARIIPITSLSRDLCIFS